MHDDDDDDDDDDDGDDGILHCAWHNERFGDCSSPLFTAKLIWI